jgi:hypothetical protein
MSCKSKQLLECLAQISISVLSAFWRGTSMLQKSAHRGCSRDVGMKCCRGTWPTRSRQRKPVRSTRGVLRCPAFSEIAHLEEIEDKPNRQTQKNSDERFIRIEFIGGTPISVDRPAWIQAAVYIQMSAGDGQDSHEIQDLANS